MVKWLEEITVTEGESDNFYHFHDNRVLPSHVTEQLAKSEGVYSSIPVAPLSVSVIARRETHACQFHQSHAYPEQLTHSLCSMLPSCLSAIMLQRRVHAQDGGSDQTTLLTTLT